MKYIEPPTKKRQPKNPIPTKGRKTRWHDGALMRLAFILIIIALILTFFER